VRDEVRQAVRESSLYLVGRIKCYFATKKHDEWRAFIVKERYTVFVTEPTSDEYYKELPLIAHDDEHMEEKDKEEAIYLEISNIKRFLFWESVHGKQNLTDVEIDEVRKFLDQHIDIIKQIPQRNAVLAQEMQ